MFSSVAESLQRYTMRHDVISATAAIITLRNGAEQGSVSLGRDFSISLWQENHVSFLGVCKQEVVDLGRLLCHVL